MTVRFMGAPNAVMVPRRRAGLHLRGLGDYEDDACCDYSTVAPVDTVAPIYTDASNPVYATAPDEPTTDSGTIDLDLPTQAPTTVSLEDPTQETTSSLEAQGYTVDALGVVYDSGGNIVGVVNSDGTVTNAPAATSTGGATSSQGSGSGSSGSSSGSGFKLPSTGAGSGTSSGLPPTLQASCSPSTITPGQTTTLSWSAQNASYVTVNGNQYPTSGSMSLSPSASATYQVVAYNSTGQTVSVNAPVTVSATAASGSSWLNQSTLVSGSTNEAVIGYGIAALVGIGVLAAVVKK